MSVNLDCFFLLVFLHRISMLLNELSESVKSTPLFVQDQGHLLSCRWVTCGCEEWHHHQRWSLWWGNQVLRLHEWPVASVEGWYASLWDLWKHFQPIPAPVGKIKGPWGHCDSSTSDGTHFSGQIFKDSSRIDSSRCTDSSMTCGSALQVSMDTSNRELINKEEATRCEMSYEYSYLKTSTSGSADGLGLGFSSVFSSFSSSLWGVRALVGYNWVLYWPFGSVELKWRGKVEVKSREERESLEQWLPPIERWQGERGGRTGPTHLATADGGATNGIWCCCEPTSSWYRWWLPSTIVLLLLP